MMSGFLDSFQTFWRYGDRGEDFFKSKASVTKARLATLEKIKEELASFSFRRKPL